MKLERLTRRLTISIDNLPDRHQLRQEQRRADEQQQRAEDQQQELFKIQNYLRSIGIDPDDLPT